MPEAIFVLFVCIFLIIVATYFLFSALSIFILKAKRKNKKYYYKQENFLSISNLLYRMKTNAVSLATITVLCSGVIIALSVSYTLGKSMADMNIDSDYELNYQFKLNERTKKARNDKVENFNNQLKNIKDKKYFISYSKLLKLNSDGNIENMENNEDMFSKNITYLTLSTVEEFNKINNKKLEKIKNNEVYLSTNIKGINQVNLGNENYSIKKFSAERDPYYAFDQSMILVNDFNIIDNFISKINLNSKSSDFESYSLKVLINENEGENLEKYLKDFADKNDARFTSSKENWQFIQEFSGGFFFLGVLISIVFTVVTSLVLYFKQLSEAYEDKKNYIILKKLGVAEKTTIKTIKRQMKSVFILPIIVAVIHNLVLVKVVTQMLGLFGIFGNTYFLNLLMISAVFAVVYVLIYAIVQKSYKKIVWN